MFDRMFYSLGGDWEVKAQQQKETKLSPAAGENSFGDKMVQSGSSSP